MGLEDAKRLVLENGGIKDLLLNAGSKTSFGILLGNGRERKTNEILGVSPGSSSFGRLFAGDMIEEINGVRVSGPDVIASLQQANFTGAKVYLKIRRHGQLIGVEMIRQDVAKVTAMGQMVQAIHGLKEASRTPGFDLQAHVNMLAHQFQDFCTKSASFEVEVAARIRRVQEEIVKASEEQKLAPTPVAAATQSSKDSSLLNKRISDLEVELKKTHDQLKQKDGDLQRAKNEIENMQKSQQDKSAQEAMMSDMKQLSELNEQLKKENVSLKSDVISLDAKLKESLKAQSNITPGNGEKITENGASTEEDDHKNHNKLEASRKLAKTLMEKMSEMVSKETFKEAQAKIDDLTQKLAKKGKQSK
eukprot:767997-Hanusia_phi.AAC.1